MTNQDEEKLICIRCDKEVKMGCNDIYCNGKESPAHIPVHEINYHEIKKRWADTEELYKKIKIEFDSKINMVVTELVDMILDLTTQGCDYKDDLIGSRCLSSYERSFYFLEKMGIIEPVDKNKYWYKVVDNDPK